MSVTNGRTALSRKASALLYFLGESGGTVLADVTAPMIQELLELEAAGHGRFYEAGHYAMGLPLLVFSEDEYPPSAWRRVRADRVRLGALSAPGAPT